MIAFGQDRQIILANVIIFGLAVFSIIASLNPHWGLWGLDIVSALPLWIRIVLVLALLVAILPPVSERMGEAIEKGISTVSERSFRISYLIFMILAFCLFIMFSSRNYLQGDGYNVMGHLIEGYIFSPTEPLDYLTHFALAKALGGGEQAVLHSYQICAYLAGLIFLYGIFLILRKKEDIIIALAIASAFAGNAVFLWVCRKLYIQVCIDASIYFFRRARS